jgi:hypothetical protein
MPVKERVKDPILGVTRDKSIISLSGLQISLHEISTLSNYHKHMLSGISLIDHLFLG